MVRLSFFDPLAQTRIVLATLVEEAFKEQNWKIIETGINEKHQFTIEFTANDKRYFAVISVEEKPYEH